jgi:hypothetical protein
MLLNRYKNFHLIQQLDPVQDHCRIYHLMNFLYVLSIFIFEPIRWNVQFGWWLMCEQEKLSD